MVYAVILGLLVNYTHITIEVCYNGDVKWNIA